MNLLNFLKTDENARRIFGERELKIIEKQVLGVSLTQSEKNRLSRDIRPKLRFIEKAAKFADEFGLEKNQGNKEMISRAVDAILKDKTRDSIKAILLFGSFADRTPTFRSDIDICVLFEKALSLKEATEFRIRISGELPDKVDIQVFDTLPQKIKRDIARNHKVLYRTISYDNINFSIKYLKDDDYFIRMEKIFGAAA